MIDRLLKCGVVWLALVWSLFGLEASNTQKRYFQCYDIKNGLTQNTVLSILQDHNGFMWFGTKDGLNRFDGKEFKSFIYGENDEYECRFVSTLCEASDGLIWVGTDWGVCYYDERTEEIYPFTMKSTDGLTIANPVSLICEPRPGELWIVVERQGIFRYDLKTKQLHNVSVKDKRYQQVVFTSMAFDDKGRVWLGTFGQGLVYTDDGFKTIHEYRDAAGQEPLASQVVTKIALHSGVLYVSTEYTGLHIIDVVTNQMSTLFQHDETGAVPYIRDFLFYGDTEVWLATESGLYIYDMVTRSSSHYRHSLNDAFSISDNALYVLYRDREGGVWIGSYFGGVNYLQSNRPYFEKFYPGTSGLHGQQVREFCGDREVARGRSVNNQAVEVAMPEQVKLWSPDAPNLYDLQVRILRDGKVVDQVSSYAAMRKYSMRRDDKGIVRFQLNNRDIFHFGPLDQGWWPDGLYTAPSYEAMIYDVKKTKDWGFNMIRKHVKVEPALWYTYCDRIGMIVWQDMPSSEKCCEWQNRNYFEGTEFDRSAESEANYRREWKEIMDYLYSYPCISTWVPFNEAWGQFKTVEITEWTQQYDPSRLVNSASGGNFFMCGDILDLHHYPGPSMYLFDAHRANVLGEYGGIGYPMEGHLWAPDRNWGYIQFKSSKEVTDQYVEYAEQLLDLIERGFTGAVYTQTTDVEIEVNGIMTYDRKVVKMDEDRIREINSRICHSLDK